jgi:hypothetical protein
MLIGLIVLLAVLVPVGLYFLSTIPFTNGTTGSNLSVPDTGVATMTAAPANGGAGANPAGAAGRTTGKIMSLVLIDQATHEPIAGLTVQNNLRNRFSGKSDAAGKATFPNVWRGPLLTRAWGAEISPRLIP